MIKLYDTGVYLVNGSDLCSEEAEVLQKTGCTVTKADAAKGTMAYSILKAHNQSDNMNSLQLDSRYGNDDVPYWLCRPQSDSGAGFGYLHHY